MEVFSYLSQTDMNKSEIVPTKMCEKLVKRSITGTAIHFGSSGKSGINCQREPLN